MIKEDNKATMMAICVVAAACILVGVLTGFAAGATAGVGVGMVCWMASMGIAINCVSTAQKTYHEECANIRLVR